MGELCGSVDGVALGTDGSSSMILGYIGSWFPTCLLLFALVVCFFWQVLRYPLHPRCGMSAFSEETSVFKDSSS